MPQLRWFPFLTEVHPAAASCVAQIPPLHSRVSSARWREDCAWEHCHRRPCRPAAPSWFCRDGYQQRSCNYFITSAESGGTSSSASSGSSSWVSFVTTFIMTWASANVHRVASAAPIRGLYSRRTLGFRYLGSPDGATGAPLNAQDMTPHSSIGILVRRNCDASD